MLTIGAQAVCSDVMVATLKDVNGVLIRASGLRCNHLPCWKCTPTI